MRLMIFKRLLARSPNGSTKCRVSGFLFRHPPFGLGFQAPRLVLCLLPGFGLRLSQTFFRRSPWLVQRFDNLTTQALDLLAHGSRLHIEMTQGTPIDILTQRDGRENGIMAPFGLVLESGN